MMDAQPVTDCPTVPVGYTLVRYGDREMFMPLYWTLAPTGVAG